MSLPCPSWVQITWFGKNKANACILDINIRSCGSNPCYLYSSLCPYAIVMSLISRMTSTAQRFMRSIARRSLGLAKLCSCENLHRSLDQISSHTSQCMRYLWKPRPSIRTTSQVLGRSLSTVSKWRTYSYFEFAIVLGGKESFERNRLPFKNIWMMLIDRQAKRHDAVFILLKKSLLMVRHEIVHDRGNYKGKKIDNRRIRNGVVVWHLTKDGQEAGSAKPCIAS